MSRTGVEDGAVGLVVDKVRHEGALLVLGEAGRIAACRAEAVLQVGVAARGVAAYRALVSAMRAGLEERQEAKETVCV